MRYLILFLTSVLVAQDYSASFELGVLGQPFDKPEWNADNMSASWVSKFDLRSEVVDDFTVDGDKALKISYPVGTYGTTNSGAQAKLVLDPQDTYFLSYWLRFSDDFSWGTTSEGGKLPGLAGGTNCSGGSTCNGTNGFTCRYMWRPGGKAILYLYHMDKPGTYGEDIDFEDASGSPIYFSRGEWIHIIEKVTVNSVDAGVANFDGQVKIWYNGELALERTGLRFVNNDDKVDLFYFSTFHGGSNSDWAPQVDSYIWYDDIIIDNDSTVVFQSLITGIDSPNKEREFASRKGSEWTAPGYPDLQLVDLTGQVIQHGTDRIITNGLTRGIYVLVGTSIEGEVRRQRIQIE